MDAITTGIWRGRGMTREELAKAIREDYERKGVWACKSNTINMQLDFEMLGIILEALEQEPTTKNDCETCIHNKGVLECDMYGCKYEPTTKNDLGVDAVSRKEVIDWLKNWTLDATPLIDFVNSMPPVTPQEPRELTLEDVKGYCKSRCLTIITNELYHELIHSKIKALEQEPRKGHWMKSNIGGAKVCSVCNAHMGLSSFKFCPSCGSDNREVKE